MAKVFGTSPGYSGQAIYAWLNLYSQLMLRLAY